MRKETFDFNKIVGRPHFYRRFSECFALHDSSINDQGNLQDAITHGRLPLS